MTESGTGARNSGPVVFMPPPPPTTTTFKADLVHRRDVVEVAGGVQLVCTNPGCTVAAWMDEDDWEARLTSARRHQQRGWNGDEDDWLPDHAGPSAATASFPEQLACPCGRGWRRRATMPSLSSPAAVAARLERQQQLRLMRRSEPMLAAGAPVLPHLTTVWPDGPCHWSSTPPDSDGDGLWTSGPAMVQARFGLRPQPVGAERCRPETHAVSSSRLRVFSEPETYDSSNKYVTAAATNGYVCPGKVGPHQSHQLLMRPPLNGHRTLQTTHLVPSSTMVLSSGQHLGGSQSQNLKQNCVDVPCKRGQICAGQEFGRQRNVTSLTPKRLAKPSVVSDGPPASVNGDRAADVRASRASPDSMSSDSGSSVASTGSATGRRKPPTSGIRALPAGAGPAADRPSNVICSRGNIFRQRSAAELAVFRSLSLHCNAYEVQTSGDDAPYGKDRLRTHVLVALSAARRAVLDCVVCSAQLVIYHDFPLIDGLFFESPMRYNSDVRVEPLMVGGLHRQPLSDASKFYLNAVCFKCLQGKGDESLQCRSCASAWNGSLFVIGNVYLYDIFAATLCCDARLACRRCEKPACDVHARPTYYSDFSRQVRCEHCRTLDHHYVKPLHVLFTRVARKTTQPTTRTPAD